MPGVRSAESDRRKCSLSGVVTEATIVRIGSDM